MMTRFKIRTRYIHPSAPRALSESPGILYPPMPMPNHGKKSAMNKTKVAAAPTTSPRPQCLTSKFRVQLGSWSKALPEACDGPRTPVVTIPLDAAGPATADPQLEQNRAFSATALPHCEQNMATSRISLTCTSYHT